MQNNKQHCIEFLGWRLNYACEDNMLEDKMCAFLYSDSMVALCRIMAITLLSLVLPMKLVSRNLAPLVSADSLADLMVD